MPSPPKNAHALEPHVGHLLAHQPAARAGRPAEEDHVGVKRARLGEQRLEVLLVGGDVLVVEHRPAEPLERGVEDVGEALPVRLVVVDDERHLVAQLVRELRARGTLLGIDGAVAEEGVNRRMRAAQLRGVRAARERVVRRGGRDLRQPGVVGERDLSDRNVGVEGSDHREYFRIGDEGFDVLRTGGGIVFPLHGVVER